MTVPPTHRRPGPLLAPNAGAGRFSFLATVALSFVASLIVIAGVAAGGGAPDWRGRLIGSATVVVAAAGLESPDAAAARAAEDLGAMAGVSRAWPLDAADIDPAIARLVAGKSVVGGRLVAVEFKAGRSPRSAVLSRALKADGLDASIDDHRPWTSPVRRAAALAVLAAAALLAAIVAAVGAIAALATRRRLAARRDLVELVRLAGAPEGFIGGVFAARSAKTAAWAGAVGAVAAALVVTAWRMTGESQASRGILPFVWADLAASAPWPFITALVGAVAAGLTVRAAMKGVP